MEKTRYLEAEETERIKKMFNAGDTVAEIVEKTGRHHSVVSKVLRAASDLERPYQSKARILFTPEEMKILREKAEEGLSANEIAKFLPGRRKETINGKLAALGFERAERIPLETKRIIFNMRYAGKSIYEIAELTGISKSAIALINEFSLNEPEPRGKFRRVIDGDVCRIATANGKYEILVDAADVDSLPQASIYRGANGYAVTRVNGQITYLHRVIMGQPPIGKVIDHINGNRLDCRRSNLRFATHSQNTQNAMKRGVGPHGLIGIRKDAGGWQAVVTVVIGPFDTPEDAARAYDAKALEIHGEHAMTNAKRGLLPDVN